MAQFVRTERQFSAAEVADYFGVPEVTQRDWRRRDLGDGFFRPAEKGKKFMFTLSEACALAMAKVQTDSGKAISGALWTAKMSAGSAILQIELCQSGVHVEGADFDPAEKRKFIYEVNGLEDKEDAATRYIFFPAKGKLHTSIDGSEVEGPTCYHFASLSEMENRVEMNWVYGSVFNLAAFALSLAFKLKEPLITYHKIEGEV